MKDELRIAMLASGSGTTMAAIIEASNSGRLLGIKPVLVIASRPDAGAIEKAKALGMSEKDIKVLSRKSFAGSDKFGAAILKECRKRRVDLIGQYGWMVKTPANVIEAYAGFMINQHPGPLDPGQLDFGGKGMFGLRVHAAVLYFSRRVLRLYTEATSQRVAIGYDEGKVLKRKSMEILETDDPYSLAKRLLPLEHEVQIETLQDFASGTVTELTRETPLIFPDEVEILNEAKRVAALLFPHG